MGEIVLTAKVTHVPTMLLSERPGRLFGTRAKAIEGHREIGRRARALGADTIVVLDTHWMVNAGYHVNSNARYKGVYTSHEFPQFIQGLTYDLPGNPVPEGPVSVTATVSDSARRSPPKRRAARPTGQRACDRWAPGR